MLIFQRFIGLPTGAPKAKRAARWGSAFSQPFGSDQA
jgi:hypothetical protein